MPMAITTSYRFSEQSLSELGFTAQEIESFPAVSIEAEWDANEYGATAHIVSAFWADTGDSLTKEELSTVVSGHPVDFLLINFILELVDCLFYAKRNDKAAYDHMLVAHGFRDFSYF
jgi:hypothetical protein